MRILLCEDQDSIRHMIETLVASSGHEVVAVPQGDRAIELARDGSFDVVLLDLMLPGALDGFAVCERLRADPITAETPIFIISAMDDSESKARAMQAGANAFFSKPFRPLELLADIKRTRERRPK